MPQESSIRPGPRARGHRGISTAIAGLIVLTFLLVVAVPLLLNIYSGSVQSHLALSTELTKKLQAVSQNVNITYDPVSSTPPTLRVYIAENNGPGDIRIEFYVVTDGARTYLVKAVNTYDKYFSIGSVEVETAPVSAVSIMDKYIVLKAPLGKALIKVVGGKLLGAVLATGSYVHVNTPTVSGVTTTYAEVAASIKTNYVNLTTFNSLADLFENPNLALVTDPSQNQSNLTLLNLGAFQTICFHGVDPDDPGGGTSGGFQPVVDSEQVNAVYIHNLGVWPGSMVLGGRSTEYNTNPIRFSLYMAGYDLIAYNYTDPGFIVISASNNEYAFCYSFVFDNAKAVSDCMPEGGANWGSTSLISRTLYDMVAEAANPSPSTQPGSIDSNFNTVYTPKLGLVFWNTEFVAYCPPGNFNLDTSTGKYIFSITGTCWFAERYGNSEAYEGIVISGSVLTIETPQEIFGDNDAGIRGPAQGSIKYIVKYIASGDLIWNDKLYPMVVKLTYLAGDKNVLSVYDNVAGKVRSGLNAFGIYLYSGQYFSTISGEYYVYYYVRDLYGEDGKISVFEFQPGTTSGLRPYMVLADTDGNGLSELVLIDEWFSPDYYSSGQTDLADLVEAFGKTFHPVYLSAGWSPRIPSSWLPYYGYGCIEKTISYFYLKFMGVYAVNGSQIAEVSVQIRYSFHDNLAGDLDEVDDQMAGIWGFAVIDSSGNETASSLYIYQQLQNYEDTWPVSMPFHTDAVYLPIPNKPELYYIVFKFGDPYEFVRTAYANIHDDADMTIRIEWLGMWYLHR